MDDFSEDSASEWTVYEMPWDTGKNGALITSTLKTEETEGVTLEKHTKSPIVPSKKGTEDRINSAFPKPLWCVADEPTVAEDTLNRPSSQDYLDYLSYDSDSGDGIYERLWEMRSCATLKTEETEGVTLEKHTKSPIVSSKKCSKVFNNSGFRKLRLWTYSLFGRKAKSNLLKEAM